MISPNVNQAEQVILTLRYFLLRDDVTQEERLFAQHAIGSEQLVLRRAALFEKVHNAYQH